MSINIALRKAIRMSFVVAIAFLFIIVLSFSLAGDSVLTKPTFPVEATVLRTVSNRDVADHVLIVLQIKNVSGLHTDILSVASKNKTGPEVFEPLRLRWLQNGATVVEDVTAIQQSISLGPGKATELCLLVKQPADGDYTLEIVLHEMDGTMNDLLPAGFSAHCEVQVKQGLIKVKS
jgi:hypothetical protein